MDFRVQGIIAKLKPDLIVALAGRAMADGISAGLGSDFNLAFGNQRSRNRGTEQIDALINRIGAEHREHKIADKFFAEILDINLFNTSGFSLGPRRLNLFPLTEISGKGNDLAVIFFLQPAQNDGRIQPARIGQYHLVNVSFIDRRHRPALYSGNYWKSARSIGISRATTRGTTHCYPQLQNFFKSIRIIEEQRS